MYVCTPLSILRDGQLTGDTKRTSAGTWAARGGKHGESSDITSDIPAVQQVCIHYVLMCLCMSRVRRVPG